MSDRVRAAKNQEEDASALALFFAGKIFPDVIANQFLDGAMTRVLGGDNIFGEAPN